MCLKIFLMYLKTRTSFVVRQKVWWSARGCVWLRLWPSRLASAISPVLATGFSASDGAPGVPQADSQQELLGASPTLSSTF